MEGWLDFDDETCTYIGLRTANKVVVKEVKSINSGCCEVLDDEM